MRLFAVCFVIGIAAACANPGDGDEGDDFGEDFGSGDDTGDPESGGDHFEGGNFWFSTTGVDDRCADGAFEAVFMPEGAAEEWSYPVEVPGTDELPKTYDVAMQNPYGTVTVTVAEGASEDEMLATGSAADIELGDYPGCVVSQDISIALAIVDDDTLQGAAVLATTGMDEAECPSTPGTCDVVLDLAAVRQ